MKKSVIKKRILRGEIMSNCKNLITEDVTPWHGDVFDHPNYKYTCKLNNSEVIPCLHCNNTRCKHYEPQED